MSSTKPKLDALKTWDIITYVVGHFCNDLVAAVAFTYALYFLISVQGMDSGLAGAAILCGQSMDTVNTLVTGYLSDKTTTR
eukprot:CAMPEP_0201282896 /NCGR_PEP_ID=MMETSP1317-20130820/6990_1 /ASSEMBLY_ACC=CAM_ASM_000770 /TAXON_ID=187299 /ORGANISM="Undescribed Undescribed, Strain Undescribed" /LENGTH=80 /DNA_ID=CAMNT_0047597171 /DNA_START=26 /DNA_END=268 /DNA_ORIENTATION=+